MSKIRDEEEKRKETQQHFQQSINEIFTTLGKNNDENAKLKEANLEITKKYNQLWVSLASLAKTICAPISDLNTLLNSMRCVRSS